MAQIRFEYNYLPTTHKNNLQHCVSIFASVPPPQDAKTLRAAADEITELNVKAKEFEPDKQASKKVQILDISAFKFNIWFTNKTDAMQFRLYMGF